MRSMKETFGNSTREGEGVICFTKMEIAERGGAEIPSVAGVWICSGNTHSVFTVFRFLNLG